MCDLDKRESASSYSRRSLCDLNSLQVKDLAIEQTICHVFAQVLAQRLQYKEDVREGRIETRTKVMIDPETPPTEADSGLEQRVIRFLETKHVPGLRHLAVTARGGIVLLSGRVHTYYEKQLCNQCCGRIPGLQELVNAVEVAGAMPGAAVVA